MTPPYYADESVTLYHGDALMVLSSLPDASVNCCVTSPPYLGLRDYGVAATEWPEVTYAPMVGIPPVTVPAMSCCLGAEPGPIAFVGHLWMLFAEVRRVLADDGTFWLNLGDSYATRWSSRSEGAGLHSERGRDSRGGRNTTGVPGKNLLGIPWRVAFALQDDGWILRNDIIWAKPNAMPESVTDRLARKHEHLFLFSKSPRYWFDLDPIRELILWPEKTGHTFGGNNPEISRTRGAKYLPQNRGTYRAADGEQHLGGHADGRNPGDVWNIPTQPFSAAHFAVMPRTLAERAIQAGCKPGGTVLDPFSGSGTTGLAAARHGRKYVGIDLNAEYLDLSLRTRLTQPGLDFSGAT